MKPQLVLYVEAEELRQVAADGEREAFERRRAQAAQVYTWHAPVHAGVDGEATPDMAVEAYVRNTAQRAYAAVDLTAPRNARNLAKQAMDAAWVIHRWFDHLDRRADMRTLDPLVENLRHTGKTFLEAARSSAK